MNSHCNGFSKERKMFGKILLFDFLLRLTKKENTYFVKSFLNKRNNRRMPIVMDKWIKCSYEMKSSQVMFNAPNVRLSAASSYASGSGMILLRHSSHYRG